MTRRIALAILLTVWAILIVGCATAYLAVRWALIGQFDESLAGRAAALPELSRPAPDTSDDGIPTGPQPRTAPRVAGQLGADRYVIKNLAGQTISPPAGGRARPDVSTISGSFTTLADGNRLRSLTLNASVLGPDGNVVPVIVTFQGSAVELDRMLDRLALGFAVFGLGAGLLTAFVASKVSRAALVPLHATADVIGTIDPRNLHRRIDLARLPPELVPMANRLNEMLERIEAAYVQRHQFLADASHELRTPVAALVTTAEVSLRHPRQAEAYRATLESCLSDARLLRRLVERLMEQCRADVLTHDEAPQEIDLVPLLVQCADQADALGHDRNIASTRTMPKSFQMTTQPHRLRSVVINLLSNAVEYSRPGDRVELRATPNSQFLHLTIRDSGAGIAAEHLPHLFEPFYRADKARSGDAGHLGLGLSLVRSHVQAMGGTVRVESAVGTGTTFFVDLPINKPGDRAI